MANKPYPGYVLSKGNPANVPSDVGDVQDVLSVQRTQVFGDTTEQCVTQFQRANQIGQTGQVGSQTWDMLFNPPPPPKPAICVNATSWANGEVGVMEQPCGSNAGPRVNQYLASVGLPPGNPWCMAFAVWSAIQECNGRGVPLPIMKTGSCSAQWNSGLQKGQAVTSPKKGDMFLCRGGSSGHYHCGYVAADPVNGYFKTIEGNSNTDGSSNGYMVVARSPGRAISSCDYLRF